MRRSIRLIIRWATRLRIRLDLLIPSSTEMAERVSNILWGIRHERHLEFLCCDILHVFMLYSYNGEWQITFIVISPRRKGGRGSDPKMPPRGKVFRRQAQPIVAREALNIHRRKISSE